MRALMLHALVRLGDIERAGQALAGLEEHDRDYGEMRVAAAALRFIQDDARGDRCARAGPGRLRFRRLAN
ncbi:MAG TPA: hypothetical protein VF070_01050 [Streptosporangiaceae bacterium]